MEGSEKRNRFIELRSEGLSYRQICSELEISRGTCSSWNAELKGQIANLKWEKLQELYNRYYMMRESRISQLGDTLIRINDAIQIKNMEEVSLDKLLDHKLKYLNELKEEFIDLGQDKTVHKMDEDFICNKLIVLLEKVQQGNITHKQMIKEMSILFNIQKVYEAMTMEKKIDELKSLLK